MTSRQTDVAGGERASVPAPTSGGGSPRWVIVAVLLAAAGLTLWSYLPGLEAGFLFDDEPNIVQVPALHWTELSLAGLAELVTGSQIPRRLVANATFALNHLAGGLDPRGYHQVNLWIHLVVGASLAWLAWLYATATGGPDSRRSAPLAAAVVAALFLLHPLNIQAVTYVVQRMSSLAALFSLWALGLYLLARRSRTTVRAAGLYTLATVTWILALGSKENALALAGVVFAFELCFRRHEWAQLVRALPRSRRRWWILAAVAGALLVATLVVLEYTGSSGLRWAERFPGREFNGWERVLTQPRVQLLYLSLLLFPAPSRLNLDHDFTISRSLVSPPETAAAVGLWLAVLAGVLILARRRPRWGFPLLAYLILHAIESGPINLELVFEHRMYLPMTALALLAAVLIVDLPPRPRRAAIALAMAATLPLAASTYRRNVVWSDIIAFHYDCARKSPEKYRPQYNLGTQLGKAGRYAEALPSLEKAVELRPESATAHNQLGTAHLRLRQLEKALPEFYRAVALDPEHAYAHYNIAWILDHTGRPRQALPHLRRFLELDPEKLAAFRAPVERRLREISGAQAAPDG